MPKRKVQEGQPEFVGEKPPMRVAGTSWVKTLEPLVKHPGEWAKVKEYDTPEQALNAQSNLTKRIKLKIRVPVPDGDWEFAAREGALFAVFRGGKRRARSVRRTQ